MKIIRFFILLILLAPLVMSFSFFKPKQRDYADIARAIRADVGKKLAKRHQMEIITIGGGMMGSVYMIGLGFKIHHSMDKDEARERIIDCVEELLKAVNENEEIRPFLKNYPFTTKNVQMAIYMDYPDGKEIYDPEIGIVSVFENDEIVFSTFDKGKGCKFKNRYRESYSEALANLNHAKLNSHCKGCPNHPVNQTSTPPTSKNSCVHP